ncbi:MAG: F0F1 ATP synthase subunit A, partial [Planctomycetota bacterium]
AALISSGEGSQIAPPPSIFGELWRVLDGKLKGNAVWHFFGFDNHVGDYHNGMHWFEAICFALVAALVLGVCAFLATRKYDKVPFGLQNVLEAATGALRRMIVGMIGPGGKQYVSYLSALFMFIFVMNLMGIVPGLRAPTMTLSTTLALGLTTFFVVQAAAIKANGVGGYFKHFMGDIIWLAPLMFPLHIMGECIKPLSLSLRLRGNIFGEDKVIETLLGMGAAAWVPVHFPMLLFAIFTSFLQAFIFTALACIYIATMTVHEGHEEGHEEHSDGKEKAHAH